MPLTFANPADYDRLSGSDTIAIVGLTSFAPGKPLTLKVAKRDGTKFDVPVNHTFNDNQIAWCAEERNACLLFVNFFSINVLFRLCCKRFKAGSALNKMALDLKANKK